MELKAVKEYKSPEYPTMEESKNRILMMMVRTGKISLGVAVMCLLCNCSCATTFATFPVDPLAGDVAIDVVPIENIGLGWGYHLKDICLLVLVIVSLITIVLSIINDKKYKNCSDENKKEELHKKRNKTFIVGLVISIVLILIIMVLNLAIPRYSIY